MLSQEKSFVIIVHLNPYILFLFSFLFIYFFDFIFIFIFFYFLDNKKAHDHSYMIHHMIWCYRSRI